MTDDSDPLDRASTKPLPAVDSADDQHRTQPLQPADVSAGIPDAPTTPHQSALTLPDEYTEMIPADLALPGDETGASSLFEDVPTQELPDEETLVAQSEPRVSDEDATNPGAVSDDAFVRRVVLPLDLPTSPLPPGPSGAKTQPTVLPAQPRNPLPSGQLPPVRGPVPLPQFQASANAQETRAAEVQHEADRTMQVFGSALGLAGVWAFGANLLAGSTWIDPTTFFLVSLVGLLPVAVLTVVVGRPRFRALQPQDATAFARPVGAAAVVLLLAALPWQLGFVREEMRGLAGESPEAMRSVLTDRAGTVALAECRRLAPEFAKPGIADVLADTLASRPEVLRQCLQSAPDVAGLLSSMLARTWYDSLIAADTPLGRACEIAGSIAALERPPGEVETRLLGCIMLAPDGAQRCCASTLAESDGSALEWVGRVQNQRGYVPDVQTANGLLALTFGSKDISAEQARFVEDADFRGVEPQRMAVVLGCAAIADKAAVGAQFANSIPDDCPVDRASFPTDTDTWAEICDASMERLVRRRRDPAETLCLGAQSVALDRAQSAARDVVRAASTAARRNQTR